MKDFSSLLERVRQALGSDSALRESVKQAVEECLHARIEDQDFNIKSGVLTITAGPMLKSELRLKEAEFLRCIQDKVGRKVSKIVYY